MRRFFRIHLPNILISALLFGVGTGVGTVIASLLFSSGFHEPIRDLFAGGRLITGVILVVLVVGLGGAIGGGLGGLALSYISKSPKRWFYVWRTALSFGLSNALILVPLTLYIAAMAVYKISDLSPIRIMIPLAVIGALFGLICGLMLGLLTVAGRNAWRVVLASIVGFALAGFMFGYGLWGFFFGIEEIRRDAWIIFTSFFAFGAIGGGALGFIYSWLNYRIKQPSLIPRLIQRFEHFKIYGRIAAVIGVILLFLIIRSLWLISPFSAEAAPLESQIALRTIGTHWRTPTVFVDQASQPAVGAKDEHVAITWVHDDDIYFAWENPGMNPVNISNSDSPSASPQLVTDGAGNSHIVWSENGAILYSQCDQSGCTTPVELSGTAPCLSEPGSDNIAPTIAVDGTDTLMVVWQNGRDTLLFSTWAIGATQPDAVGCVPSSDATQNPRVSAGVDGTFGLVFEQNDDVVQTQFQNGAWQATPEVMGTGRQPTLFVDQKNQSYIAWCDSNNQINYQLGSNPAESIEFPPCAGRPEVTADSNGLPRLVWYAEAVKNVRGIVNPSQLLYESVRNEDGWSEPRIIAQTNGPVQTGLAASGDGNLHLVWADGQDEAQNLYYTRHTKYDCTGEQLSEIGQVIYDAVRQEKFRPPSDMIPYCQNQFDRLIYAPNPNPAFSEEPPSPNGVFDVYAELARTAQYEVVYATMWYEADQNNDSPGFVIAEAVADLYHQLKANPSHYPRGLTVRLFLGNPPSPALFPTFNNQIRLALEDFRAAGVPEMRNDEIGWNLEVGNYVGSWPHSHTKMMVVDGKTAIGAGYNLQYAHYPKDHPSGLGKDKVDLGLQITGPIAQSTLRTFDDVWEASVKVYCSDLDPDSSFWWMFSCRTGSATGDHVPEVLQFYLPDTDDASHSFSLNRTQAFRESDEAYFDALAAAKSSIDIVQVNFSLHVICDLGLLLEVCNFNDHIEPQGGLMQAVDSNKVHVRILVKETPFDGIENKIAITELQKELASRGLSDFVEIRYFDGDLIHAKAALIDKDWLVVGSQNFHYSAWGDQALTEYNLLTDDPDAIAEFEKAYNYLWDDAVPVE